MLKCPSLQNFRTQKRKTSKLVAVHLWLEWTLDLKAKVLSLDWGELGELSVDVGEMELGDLLIENLWKNVDADWELLGLAELNVLLAELSILALEQHDLGKDLVGERAGHDEGGVTGGTAKVDQATLSEEDDVAAVLHQEAVDLWLDVLDGGSVGLQPGDVDLNIEVTNVANDGIVWHGLEVLANEDITAAGGGDEDLTLGGSLLHWHDLETRDSSLEGVDWINLGDDNAGTHGVESHGASLSDITETGDNGDLTGDHDIGGTLDTIDKGLTAAVKVVELGLGDGVVDVDGWNKELALLEHLVKVVNTGGGLLRDTVAVLEHLWVLLVDKSGQISTIVEDDVEGLAVLEGNQLLLQAPLVLLLGLTLPGEDWDTSSGDGSGGVVLGGENVAGRPGNLSTEEGEGLDEDSGLDGHVKTSGNAGTLQWLISSVLGTGGHKTWHLILSELDLLAAKGSEGKVGDLELGGWSSRHVCGYGMCGGV